MTEIRFDSLQFTCAHFGKIFSAWQYFGQYHISYKKIFGHVFVESVSQKTFFLSLCVCMSVIALLLSYEAVSEHEAIWPSTELTEVESNREQSTRFAMMYETKGNTTDGYY